jgi:hypothetical protein
MADTPTSEITFVKLARREVENTVGLWHRLKVSGPAEAEDHLANLYQLADKLVSTQIMLLRAIEEAAGARPRPDGPDHRQRPRRGRFGYRLLDRSSGKSD